MIGWKAPFGPAGAGPAGLPAFAPSVAAARVREPRTLPPFATVREAQPQHGVVRELVMLVAVVFAVAATFKTFVAQPFYIPSGSMIPQLDVNDRILVSKLAFKLHEPRRGDIVVFDSPVQAESDLQRRAPTNPVAKVIRGVGEGIGLVPPIGEEFVKRVVGLPGDVVDIRDGHVYVNGQLLQEPYLDPSVYTTDGPQTLSGPITVGPDQLWVMGDNRPASSDSRFFGLIHQDKLVGRAVVKVWPLHDASFL